MKQFYLAVVVVAGVWGLMGCSEESGSKAQNPAEKGVSNVATPAAVAPVNELTPSYEASLTEGIDFKKPGYPNFLTEVSGMSGYEPWGRWSDANPVRFKFKQPLPEKFTLIIKGGAIGPNIGKVFKIKIGTVENEMVLKSDPFKEPITYRVSFVLSTPSDTINITVPEPWQPSGSDPRKLGIGIISLKIEN